MNSELDVSLKNSSSEMSNMKIMKQRVIAAGKGVLEKFYYYGSVAVLSTSILMPFTPFPASLNPERDEMRLSAQPYFDAE